MLRIGELATRTGFTAKTLRYYEEIDLLRPTARSDSGYRLHDGAALDRLRFIRRSRSLGLRLNEVRSILEISDEGRVPCEHVVTIVDRQSGRHREANNPAEGVTAGPPGSPDAPG